MNIPIIIGWPQVFLFIVALIGLGLLISSAMSLYSSMSIRRERREWEERKEEYEERKRDGEYEKDQQYAEGEQQYADGEVAEATEVAEVVAAVEDEEAREYYRKFQPRRRFFRHRHFLWRRSVSGGVVMIIALLLLWVAFIIQAYLGLTSDILAAKIVATPIANTPQNDPEMSIELVLYDQSGHVTSHQTYTVMGDEWMLQGDIIKFPPWLGIFGLHSGYKVTRLEGTFSDPAIERVHTHTVVELNGGEDGFFTTMRSGGKWYSFLVEAYYGNAVFQQPDGKVYDIFISNTGLFAKPEG